MLFSASRAVAVWAGAASSLAIAQVTPPQVTPGPEVQRLQEQQLDQARDRANARPDVFTAPAPAGPITLSALPKETPCFPIQGIVLEDNVFNWLPYLLQPVNGQCVGKQGLEAIELQVNNALIEHGYVTSRVLIPQQNLAAGTLVLKVLPGRIGAIRNASDDNIGWARMALLAGPGDLLNQRDLDQALETVRRLPGQSEASFDIVPGAQVGESDIVLKPGTDKRWHATLSADNTGLKNTGKYQMSGSLVVDSPLHLYDQLAISASSNTDRGAATQGTRSYSINWSVPVGYATVFVGANRSRYRQTVAGFEDPIVYSGQSSEVNLGISGVLHRDATSRTGAQFKVFRKINRNYLDDTEIEVQRRDVVGYEASMSHRHYVGPVALDGGIAWRETLPDHSNVPGVVVGDTTYGGRSQIETANASLYWPFKVASQVFEFSSNWAIQHARTRVLPSDYFTIGNRYTVRGFDGQLTLAAEDGWYWRNELAWRVAGQAIYGGIDVGKVHGPSAESLLGEQLVGAVIGVRGRVPSGRYAAVNYDLSFGWPLSKPAGLRTERPAVMAQVGVEF
ncbi:ShlB/FhaC/HecB family hemolysin secretion/activation protein [Ralstonia pseudosolanacearum]|uniref:ShlB/FhaC/HecB family hemolysin secretion/activation protein n=3 Tax=Ralstonia pseudosolanacearum TaxID=1310165 RepID=UPI002675C344|nr:ShlB/FhaC/HecB family hemolysin secretion/activation protein [Ralstonia pseudosolanacearum]MDO3510142.1 ShlB/FhaC/HecB family hemolysin secretion/activation protein [Ralstonia pseudosolanacearum]MDO3512260.1 ShlB/FhaC/HecB family hemolysin secretion/activation protein [Ralstonia pseudosolanacearum]MDO3525089.1 ShlB/FhaC/HecB family hemolysin secretion/activation protein [Ralstonia pseudosolanacearum]MDO3539169.1 ShlB/FhaC/HecB family hemolysin secretion/activation protein [Ralstonia pseudoso